MDVTDLLQATLLAYGLFAPVGLMLLAIAILAVPRNRCGPGLTPRGKWARRAVITAVLLAPLIYALLDLREIASELQR